MNDDVISRQAAIELITENSYLVRTFGNSLEKGMTLCGITQALDEVPSAPQKTGQWQYTNTTKWDAKDKDGEQELEISIVSAECSVCGRWAEQINNFPPYMQYNYCPHCGARMGVTE